MDKKPLKIERLHINKMPGLSRDKDLEFTDFSETINIIYGPNASGKSTTSEVIKKLIWGNEDRKYGFDGNFILDQDQWKVTVDGGFNSKLKNGSTAETLPLPADEVMNRYLLDLKRLLTEDDEFLAKRILDESIGGVNLDEARKSLNYGDGVGGIRIVSDNYKAALKEYNDELKKHSSSKDSEATLSQRKEALEKAKKAKIWVEFYKELAELDKLQKEYNEKKLAFEMYPKQLENLREEDEENILTHEKRLEELDRIIEDTKRNKERIEEELKALKLKDEGVSVKIRTEIEEKIEELSNFERKANDLKGEIEGLTQAKETLIRQLNTEIDFKDWKDIELSDLNELELLAKRSLEIFIEKEKITNDIRRIEEKDTNFDENILSKLTNGKQLLYQWLESRMQVQEKKFPWWIPVVSILLGGIAGLLLWQSFTPAIFPFALLLIALFIPFLIPKFQKSTTVTTSAIEKRYRDLGINETDWNIEAVNTTIAILQERYEKENSKQIQAKLEERELSNLKPKLEEVLKEENKQISNHQKWIDRLQVNPGFETLKSVDLHTLYNFFKIVRDIQDKTILIEEKKGLKRSVSDKLQEILMQINSTFKSFGFEEGTGTSECRGTLREIKTEQDTLEKLQNDLKQSELDSTRNEEEKVRVKEGIESIFTRLKINEENRNLLPIWTRDLKDFLEKRQEKRDAKNLHKVLTEKINNHPLFTESEVLLDEISLEDINKEIEKHSKIAESEEAIAEKIKEIEGEIEKHSTGNTLENALEKKEKALDAVEEVHKEEIRRMTGKLIMDQLKKEIDTNIDSDFYKRINELFSGFTNYDYALSIKLSDKPEFNAIETKTGEELSLDELSAGTRVQLILAVRIAYLEFQERDIKLPLIADELLANSDDARAKAIIQALVKISKEGRQTFYFTAQQDEVNKWVRHIGANEISTYHLEEGMVKTTEFEAENYVNEGIDLVREIPEPNDNERETYKEVLSQAGSFESFDIYHGNVNSLHLWYLIEDLDLLYSCLTKHISNWGGLLAYLKNGTLEGLSTEMAEEFKAKVKLLETYQGLIRHGREKKIDRDVLIDSGAVTNTMIDRVVNKLTELDNSPTKLIDSLYNGEVSRFQQTEKLEEYLMDNGYISTTEPYTKEEIAMRLNAQIENLGLDAREVGELLGRF